MVSVSCADSEVKVDENKDIKEEVIIKEEVNESIYHIYIDADWDTEIESSRSIEMGINTALLKSNYELDGKKVKIIRINHKANPNVHLYNLKNTILKDDKALVVYSGLHSPPLFKNLDFINENNILTLDAWAAGGGITRSGLPNWIFRLSVDDKYAGRVMIDYGVEKKKIEKFAICAVDDEWGHWNIENIINRSKELGLEMPKVYLAPLNVSLLDAKVILRDIGNEDIDGIIMIVHPSEAISVVRAMAEIEDNYKLPIVSHWSVTGSNFISCITTSKNDEKYFDISKVDLSFIQPSFIFNKNDSIINRKLIDDVKLLYPEINEFDDIQPPAGFVNAYDLTLILIEASKQAKLTGDIERDKIKLHEALENLQNPVKGLIKTYDMPFSQYSKDNDDAHEALNETDFMMAKFDKYGKVVDIEED